MDARLSAIIDANTRLLRYCDDPSANERHTERLRAALDRSCEVAATEFLATAAQTGTVRTEAVGAFLRNFLRSIDFRERVNILECRLETDAFQSEISNAKDPPLCSTAPQTNQSALNPPTRSLLERLGMKAI
jgi:hypothetical protein